MAVVTLLGVSFHVSTTNDEKETTRVSSATNLWAFGPLNWSLLFSSAWRMGMEHEMERGARTDILVVGLGVFV